MVFAHPSGSCTAWCSKNCFCTDFIKPVHYIVKIRKVVFIFFRFKCCPGKYVNTHCIAMCQRYKTHIFIYYFGKFKPLVRVVISAVKHMRKIFTYCIMFFIIHFHFPFLHIYSFIILFEILSIKFSHRCKA